MSKCPHCGAEFQFDAKSQLVHCKYCGSDFNPDELNTDIKVSKVNENVIEGKSYCCTQCGASLLSFDETAVTFCSYCGSQNIIEDKMVKQTAPDYIIPFSKTQDECIKNYKKQLSSFLFAPSYMKDEMLVKKFRGIYIPYGIYRIEHNGDCTNKGEVYSHRSNDYIYYDEYTIHADVDASYSGISFDLLSKFYDEYSQSIPFNYKGVVDFNPNYLPGFYADSKDVDINIYDGDVIDIGASDSTNFLKKERIFRKYNCHNPQAKFDIVDKKVGMFPIYFLASRSTDGKHLHYAVINGQTGKVAADIPISFGKYIIFAVIFAIPIFFLLNIGPVILPKVTSIFTIIMAIASWIVCASQISRCNQRDSRYGDKGYNSRFTNDNKKNKQKIPPKYKLESKQNFKYLGAIAMSFTNILLNPVSDLSYYITSSIGLLLVILSFNDIVKIHNQLVSRAIPQLEKRGGDESE